MYVPIVKDDQESSTEMIKNFHINMDSKDMFLRKVLLQNNGVEAKGLKRIVLLVLMMIGIGLLSGCTGTEKNKFIGTWKSFEPIDTLTYEFFSNGTVRATSFIGSYKNQFFGNLSNYSYLGSWELKNGKLIMNTSGIFSSTLDYNFSNNDTILIIAPSGTADQNLTLIKQ